MKLETGLRFDWSAADAFGCLEVYWFPSLDEAEYPRVQVHYAREAGLVRISLCRDDAHAEYAVHARGTLVWDIASDEMQVLEAGVTDATFQIPSRVDALFLQVWTRKKGARWMLWHEQEDHFLRTVHTRAQFAGLSGTASAPWLEKLSRMQDLRMHARVERFSRIQQVSIDVPQTISFCEPWERKVEEARELVAEVNPPRSKSRFFPRGLGTDENKLAFAEWLREVLSSSTQTIVVVDPYFDLLGLDLLCRASGAARELVVLTSTQLPSDDDGDGPTRSARLRSAAAQHFSLLRGLNLRICDLQSPTSTSRSKQLFHDRYLLMLDGEGRPTEGYNLSTSLQSATMTSPLLATEIPRDVLTEVACYVSGLLAPQGSTVLETLYPPHEVTRPNVPEPSEHRVRAVVATLKAAGRDVGQGEGEAFAAVESLWNKEERRFDVTFSNHELGHVAYVSRTAPLEEAALVWDGLVEAAIRAWNSGVPELLRCLRDNAPRIDEFLICYLVGHGTGELTAEGSILHTRTRARLFERPFNVAINEAAQFYDHHHALPVGTTWAIHLALLLLVNDGPNGVDEVVQTLRREKDAANRALAPQSDKKAAPTSREEARRALKVLDHADAVLSAASGALYSFVGPFDSGLPDGHSASTEPFIRALWMTMHMRRWTRGQSTLDQLLAAIERLPNPEGRITLGQMVYDERVAANQALGRGEACRDLPSWLISAVVSTAEPSVDAEGLAQLTRYYSGPLLGNWALSTHADLFVPLIAAGKLTEAGAFDIWSRVLGELMEDKYPSGCQFPVLEVWGRLAWAQDEAVLAALLDTERVQLERAHRTLLEPLLASRDYKKWSVATTRVLWVFLRAWAIARARPADRAEATVEQLLRSASELARCERLEERAVGEMQQVVRDVLDELALPSPPVAI